MRIADRAGVLASGSSSPRASVGGKTKTVYVRYRDGAGNVSEAVLERQGTAGGRASTWSSLEKDKMTGDLREAGPRGL